MWETARELLAALTLPFWLGAESKASCPEFVRGRCYSWWQECRGKRRLKSVGEV